MNRQRTIWSVAFSMIAGVTLASLPFTASASEPEKMMQAEYTVGTTTELEFESGVGEIKFERAEGDVLEVSVRAYKASDAVFDKEGNIDAAELTSRQVGDRLILTVAEQDGLQLDWVIKLPKIASIETELGVGEVSGDVWASDMNIDVGVGEVDIEVYGDYASIKTDVGVGDSSIRGPGDIENNRFLMTANSRAKSHGEARISIDAGVGDVTIRVK